MCLLYALSAWGVYISIDNVGRLNKILRKAKRYVFTDSLLTFSELWEQSDEHWPRSHWAAARPLFALLKFLKRILLHPLVQC